MTWFIFSPFLPALLLGAEMMFDNQQKNYQINNVLTQCLQLLLKVHREKIQIVFLIFREYLPNVFLCWLSAMYINLLSCANLAQ